MKEFNASLEVHFYDENAGAITLATNAGSDEDFVEILVYCAFVLRQMTNLGDNEYSRGLAAVLVDLEGRTAELATAPLPEFGNLVEYRGALGAKRFRASLVSSGTVCRFQLKAEGFGWFGQGLGYYAPASALLFLRFLAKRHSRDSRYLFWLGRAAASCARRFLDGAVTGWNHAQVAAEEAVQAGVNATQAGFGGGPADAGDQARVEHRSTPPALDHDYCTKVGASLARYAIDDFAGDAIPELAVFPLFKELTREQKATWTAIRLALQLRCVLQLPELNDGHRQAVRNGAMATFLAADIGVDHDQFMKLAEFEQSMCSTRPGRLAPERPATQYLLFGFVGCHCSSPGVSPGEMRRFMAELGDLQLNAWLRDKGATVEIPIDPYAMCKFLDLAIEHIRIGKALIQKAGRVPQRLKAEQ